MTRAVPVERQIKPPFWAVFKENLRFTASLAASSAAGLERVKSRVGKIDIPGIHLLFAQAKALAKTLEVDNLPLTQEADDVVYIRVVGQAEDIIVGKAGLLLWCEVVKTTF